MLIMLCHNNVLLVILAAALVAVGCMANKSLKVAAKSTYRHDEECFTQGLLLQDNILFESCGLHGKSSLRTVNYQTGEVLKRQRLDGKYFAEGIALVQDKIYMLTWKNKNMLVFDAKTLKQIADISYQTHTGEGWGLTYDGQHLIASDGSSRLTFFEVPTAESTALVKVKHVDVRSAETSKLIKHINELQYVNGFIYANIWYKDFIVKIDSSTGLVVQMYDLTDLYPHKTRSARADCLNGIAYNSVENSFLITGKQWSLYYSVNFSAAEKNKDL